MTPTPAVVTWFAMLSVGPVGLSESGTTCGNEPQQVVGRVTLVSAVAVRPLTSVAVTFTVSAVTELGRSALAPTHEPLPESVKLMVRVVGASPPLRVRAATTLLRGDSSVTGTWMETFAHEAPLKRTVMAPTCGGRPTAPSNCNVVVGALVAVMRAGKSKRPSGKVEALEYATAVARAKVTVIDTEAPAERVPDDGLKVKNAGCVEAIFHGTDEELELVNRNVAVVPVVEKSRDVALTPSATRAAGVVVVVARGDVVVVRGVVVVVARGVVVGGTDVDGVTAGATVDGVTLAVDAVVVGPAGVETAGVETAGVETVEGGTVGSGTMLSGVDIPLVVVDSGTVVSGEPWTAVIGDSLFEEFGSEVASTRTEPATVSTTAPVIHHGPRPTKRAARGNPSLGRNRMRDVVPPVEPLPVPGVGILDVASSTRSRKPSGAARTGAAPKSANGAILPLVSSQVSQDSM